MENIRDFEMMAKLDLSVEEQRQITDLADMLIESFGAIADINTDNTEPLYTVLDIQNVLRDDVCVKMLSREELLANAPMQYDGYFQVPKTF